MRQELGALAPASCARLERTQAAQVSANPVIGIHTSADYRIDKLLYLG